MTRLFAGSALAAVIAAVGAMWFFGLPGNRTFEHCSVSNVAGGDIGGPFELLNKNGETVTDTDVITEASLVYFGYTYCPDVCPFDVARNADAVDLLAEQDVSVTPVFISIDPERDTPDVVGDFAFNLHEKMIGLTGSPDQVSEASKAYKTYYKAHHDGSQDYLVDHSTFTYLVLPEKGFVEFFRRDTSAAQMAETTACFVKNS